MNIFPLLLHLLLIHFAAAPRRVKVSDGSGTNLLLILVGLQMQFNIFA